MTKKHLDCSQKGLFFKCVLSKTLVLSFEHNATGKFSKKRIMILKFRNFVRKKTLVIIRIEKNFYVFKK